MSDSGYLRLYMSQLRKKLETDPAHPRHLLTESGMGYRLVLELTTASGQAGTTRSRRARRSGPRACRSRSSARRASLRSAAGSGRGDEHAASIMIGWPKTNASGTKWMPTRLTSERCVRDADARAGTPAAFAEATTQQERTRRRRSSRRQPRSRRVEPASSPRVVSLRTPQSRRRLTHRPRDHAAWAHRTARPGPARGAASQPRPARSSSAVAPATGLRERPTDPASGPFDSAAATATDSSTSGYCGRSCTACWRFCSRLALRAA